MMYGYGNHRQHDMEDADDVQSQGNTPDQVTEVDYPPLSLSQCPSISSSFSPSDSPLATPTSLYSQGSLPSPGWHEVDSFTTHDHERHTAGSLSTNPFRLEAISLPCGTMDVHERMTIPDSFSCYAEGVERFWAPTGIPKGYDKANAFSCQPVTAQYLQMIRHYYRHQRTPGLPASVSSLCLSRPIVNQPDRMSNSFSINNIPQWMSSAESLTEQTITPSQTFYQAPLTPPPPYSELPASAHTFKKEESTTPKRSRVMRSASGPEAPMRRDSAGTLDERENPHADFVKRPQQQPFKKTRRQSLKQTLTLENLPAVIKQVQFKCSEPGCKGRFKRQEHLKRHMKSHSKEKPHVCWVPGCHRAFSRSDNLNAHYSKTHSRRGGRNRYVATLDETSSHYDPNFRGQLTPDGRPIYGSKLEEPNSDFRELSDGYDE